jgi:uncharacterized Zn finger protein
MVKGPVREATIRALATPESLARGRSYLNDGAVSDLIRRGNRLIAEVEGSEFAPYKVSIRLHDDGIADARCSCLYDWGGYCKHIVAVLLKFVDEATDIIERKPIAELLRALDQEQLIELLAKRAETDSELAAWIDAELATMVDASSLREKTARRTAVDPAPVREHARILLAKRQRQGGYWDGYRSSGDIEELQRLVERAVPFLEIGDGRNALRILEPIAEAFVDDWVQNSSGSDEHLYELLPDLGRLMAEAALMSDLSADERDALAETLEEWQSRLEEYGVEESFQVAISALETGWDDPVLSAVIAGKGKSWPPAGHRVDDGLTAVLLRVLEGRGKTQEYLNLAQAARSHASYAVMLVKLERIPDAVNCALMRFKKPGQALALATALRAAAAPNDALKIAEAGLALAGPDDDQIDVSIIELAHWLRDYAGGMGRSALASKAARAAFENSLSLEDFAAAKVWAGDTWSSIRPELLQLLACAPHAYDRTRIYLSEGLIDDAVRSVGDRFGYSVHDETLMRLAVAAHRSHPDWVIRFATRQAAGIMDANRSGHYTLAAQWLEKAALAYEALGREDDWRARLDELIERHRRKHKLRPMLEGLRRARDTGR